MNKIFFILFAYIFIRIIISDNKNIGLQLNEINKRIKSTTFNVFIQNHQKHKKKIYDERVKSICCIRIGKRIILTQ